MRMGTPALPRYILTLTCRWERYPEQFSDPVYLEAGQNYYFEVLANQYPGPWDIGLAAKIHSLGHTSYPYQGDRESQRITITSTIARERIVSEVRNLCAYIQVCSHTLNHI